MDAHAVLQKVAAGRPQPKLAAGADPAVSADEPQLGPRGSRAASVAAPDYGRILWGPDPQRSGTLDYVRSHANRMVRRVDAEDERGLYALHRHVQDVRVYRRVESPGPAAVGPALGLSPSASFSSSRGSSRGSSRLRAPSSSVDGPGRLADAAADDWARVTGHFEFRASTRVPGTLEDVLGVLAPESGRDAYWLAANTQKNLRFTTVTRAERVPSAHAAADGPSADGPFPRWSLQYLMTKFIKHSRTMDVAFSEFAAIDPPPPSPSPSQSSSSQSSSSPSPPSPSSKPRRGFVYRRSVDGRALGDPALQRKLAAVASVGTDASVAARAHERVDRFFLQDWLLDARETDEPGVLKLVLTARALFRGEDELLRRSMRLEFREFATNYMVAARKIFTARHAEMIGDRAASARLRTPASAAASSSAAAARVCAVCSSAFSLLRKRHECRACGSSVCAKCCASKQPAAGSVSSAGLLGSGSSSSSARGRRECVLCAQFGPAAGRGGRAGRPSRVSQFSTVRGGGPASATLSPPSAASEDEDEDGPGSDLVAPALFAASFSGTAASRGHGAVVLLEDPSPLMRDDRGTAERRTNDLGTDYRGTNDLGTASPSPQYPRRPLKFRGGSGDSTSSARSSPGIVLISEIESLSLAGGFRRVPSASAASSGGFGTSLGARPRASLGLKRADRAVSEDNVLASLKPQTQTLPPQTQTPADHEDDEDEEVTAYSEDDLANFTLELAP